MPPLPSVTLNSNRQVSGVLRGFDQFMNIVLDATVDEKMKTDIGMVVSAWYGCCGCMGEGGGVHGKSVELDDDGRVSMAMVVNGWPHCCMIDSCMTAHDTLCYSSHCSFSLHRMGKTPLLSSGSG